MLTLRQMRYFEALATTLHFGRAAEMMHVSQPALSAQIAEMERHFGVPLVERGRGLTMLTRAGEDMLPRIRGILAEVDALDSGLRDGTGVLEGLIRIGIIPTVAPYIVPLLIPHLRADHPRIEIELKESITANLVDELKLGRLDAIVAALPIDADGLTAEPLFTDRFLIAGASDEDSILVSPMTQEEVDVDRLLLLEEGHCLRDQALAVCTAANGRRLVNYGATSMATLLQMVSHGMGLTLIPEIAVPSEAERHRMRVVPFAEPQPSRTIGLVWRRGSERRADYEALGAVIAASAAHLRDAARLAVTGAPPDGSPATPTGLRQG